MEEKQIIVEYLGFPERLTIYYGKGSFDIDGSMTDKMAAWLRNLIDKNEWQADHRDYQGIHADYENISWRVVVHGNDTDRETLRWFLLGELA